MPVLGIGLVLLSNLSEVILAAVDVGAAVGVIDPPLPPSGGFFPDLGWDYVPIAR